MKKEKLGLVLDKVKCSNCHKKIDVLEVSTAGFKTEHAPCKHCGCENILSSEKWERGPAEVDVFEDGEVIQYIRDLYNLSELLEKGVDSVLLAFIRQLKRAGYLDDRIHKFITLAGYGTNYEKCVNMFGEKVVPRPIPNRGDYKEWLRLKPRAM